MLRPCRPQLRSTTRAPTHPPPLAGELSLTYETLDLTADTGLTNGFDPVKGGLADPGGIFSMEQIEKAWLSGKMELSGFEPLCSTEAFSVPGCVIASSYSTTASTRL